MCRGLFTKVALVSFSLILIGSAARGKDKSQDANADSPPISIAIVYDTSVLAQYPNGGGGNYFPTKKDLFAALADFVRQGNAQNEYFIIHFNTEPHLLLDGTTDKEAALKAISQLSSFPQEGATALYDACSFAIDKLSNARYDRRAIILMSDGLETVSVKKLKDVTSALSDSKVPLYAVNIGTPDTKPYEAYLVGDRTLEKMASASDGMTLRLGKKKEKVSVFQVIAEKLRGSQTNKP